MRAVRGGDGDEEGVRRVGVGMSRWSDLFCPM